MPRACDTDAVFDFGTWVVTLLAESGRKKLTAQIFGTEQERALRAALGRHSGCPVDRARPRPNRR